MAAKEMVDRITSWMEDTAEMQTESMLELADAIRDEMGQESADAFTNSVRPALESLYSALESTRTALTGGVGTLTGEGGPMPMGSDDMGGEMDMDMEPTVDDEMPTDDLAGDDMEPADDEFGAAEPATGGDEPAGRAKRESKSFNMNKILSRVRANETVNSTRLATILSKKK